MDYRKISKNVFSVGAVDPKRKLFDELIPLPDGTTYNCYLIKGSMSTALLDTVDPTMIDVLMNNLDSLDVKKIDFIVSHHSEQDHSGVIYDIAKKFPEAVIIVNKKGKEMLINLLHIPEKRFRIVEDGQVLSLGDKTLQFIMTPWVHWPETMSTYLKEDRILFSCDFFGSHYSFDRLMITENDIEKVIPAAKRYYGEIMLPFASNIRTNMNKLQDYEMDMIAPSHGPVHDDPSFIINAYREWSSGKPGNTVVLPYISMHGSTKNMVDYFKNSLENRGVKVFDFNLTDGDIGELAAALIDAATIVIGTPTVLTGPHPLAVYAAYLVKALRPGVRFMSVIGSYGWSGKKTLELLSDILSPLKAELIEPVVIKGLPTDMDLGALDSLADKIKEAHSTILY
jgi:flavorubredoxin